MQARPLPIVLALLASSASPAPAATDQPDGLGKRLRSEIRFFGMLADNFFQAPEGVAKEEVASGRVEGRVALALPGDGAWEVYGHGRVTSYEGSLEQSSGLGVGLRYDRRPRSLDLDVRFEQDRPTLDVGDEFDRADVLRLAGEYSHRLTDDWEVTGLAEVERQEFDLVRGKDNDLFGAGGAVRYRGWGYLVSPEIGVELGGRNAVDPNQDHDQRDVWIKLRSVPAPPVYLSLRYRLRRRDYSVGSPAASNFDREDERRQWTLGADVKTGERLTWNLYYSYQDAESTKASRTFTSQFLGLGVTVGF